MPGLTLLRQSDPLADPAVQRQHLQPRADQRSFSTALADHGLSPLQARGIEVLQINVGKTCNQTCRHCHVDAGPDRREVMSRETMAICLRVLESARIPTLDVTGGAPEMNLNFRWLVSEARRLGKRVMDRCNLTILVSAGFEDLPEFLARHQVEIIASLPCYLPKNTDAQRGEGVFGRSIEALLGLNELGYGREGSDLVLNLVYNPVGPSLPPPQERLEADYRRQLGDNYGIVFNRLFTITNMPISRFLDDLLRTGRLDDYLQTLRTNFNPNAVAGLMCRTMLSVGCDGRLYDCDFNQMLDLDLASTMPRTIADFHEGLLVDRQIVVGEHCFGCTAGSGSSCGGAIAGRVL